jgi:glycosyltransferase involved in cell wall biosynthesis
MRAEAYGTFPAVSGRAIAGDNEAAAAADLRRRGVLFVEQGGRGGVADYTNCLANAIAERGIPATIATANDHLYRPGPGVRIATPFAYVRGHSAPARLARRLHLGPVLNGVRFLCALPRLFRLARGKAIVHTQGWERTSLGLIALLVLRASGAAGVYTAHNTFERFSLELDSTVIYPPLVRHTIVHTRGDRERIRHGPVSVIPHGTYGPLAERAAPVTAEAARAALGLPADALVVLLFGVLRPDKGLGDLLDAAVRSPRWRVLIAGKEDGALAAEEARLAAPELAGRVTVHEGFQEMDAVGRFFAAADIVALPYQVASQSGVAQLAYGFGRPVVAYPVGGLTEAVIDGTTGWLCAAPTPVALSAALDDAATAGREECRRRGKAGREWARTEFSWSAIAEATETVYITALSR